MTALQRRLMAHTHECRSCGKDFACSGTLERNWDGHPEVICRQYHEHGIDWCVDCQERDEDAQPQPDGIR